MKSRETNLTLPLGLLTAVLLAVGPTARSADTPPVKQTEQPPDSFGLPLRATRHWTADNGNGTYLNPLFWIHQGGMCDTPSGEWWCVIMSDHGSAGRMVSLVPIEASLCYRSQGCSPRRSPRSTGTPVAKISK